MIILIRHAQSEGNSTSRSLYGVTEKLILVRESRHSPDHPRPPRQTYTGWMETGTSLTPHSVPGTLLHGPQADFIRPKMQVKNSAPSSALQIPSTSLPLPTEEHEKRPKQSSMPSHPLPQTTYPPPSHDTILKFMKSPDCVNKILETSNPTPQR